WTSSRTSPPRRSCRRSCWWTTPTGSTGRKNRSKEAHMSLDKPYAGIPGTTIFDAEQSRKGYWLNQFCMSLMKAENRERFKKDERAYLDEWAMTEDQKKAVLSRDMNAMIALG